MSAPVMSAPVMSAPVVAPDPEPGRPGAGDAFGVYVHVPFCARRCDYCAFATWTDRHHLMEAHSQATITALHRARAGSALPAASSVFFGGGTPSLLPADQLVAILGAIERRPGAEVTVECNPDTVTAELAERYVAAGVTRLSFGVQSMVPEVLARLGRTHRPENVAAAVGHARRAGITSFNLDLIYGSVGETLDDWDRTLDAVLALDPPHVSAYALTVEAGTPLAADPDRRPDEDHQVDLYLRAGERLGEAGLGNYEISNWARPGHECRHNWLYWQQGDYLGVGCAAHSHRAGRRWWNLRTPERYVAALAEGGDGTAVAEELDAATRAAERLQLRLRTRQGVSVAELARRAHDRIPALVEHGLVQLVDSDGGPVVVLTPHGRMLANAVSNELI
jgi:putative oxygen-independent coproporphyrinogen III oxidase